MFKKSTMLREFIEQFKQFRTALRTSFFISPFIFLFYILSLGFNYISKSIGETTFVNRFIDNFFEWLVYNENYIFFIFLTIAIDHLLGTIKYFKIKQFSIKENIIGLFTKLFITIMGATLFEAMNVIAYKENVIKDYLVITTRLIVFFYPARSAFRNMSIITNGVFPPKSWIDKMDNFSMTLDYKEFTRGNEIKETEENKKENE